MPFELATPLYAPPPRPRVDPDETFPIDIGDTSPHDKQVWSRRLSRARLLEAEMTRGKGWSGKARPERCPGQGRRSNLAKISSKFDQNLPG